MSLLSGIEEANQNTQLSDITSEPTSTNTTATIQNAVECKADGDLNLININSSIHKIETTLLSNPLENDLILKKISKFLDYQTLRVGQLVSKKWNASFFPNFEEHSIVRVEFYSQESITTAEFTSLFNSAYKKGRVYKSFQFIFPEQLSDNNITDWMSEYGKNINTIKLGFIYSEAPAKFNKYCSNSMDFIYPNFFAIRLTDFNRLFFKHCPNLRNIFIPFPGIKDEDENTVKLNPTEITEYNNYENTLDIHLNTLELGTDYIKQFNNLEHFALVILKRVKSITNLIMKSDLSAGSGGKSFVKLVDYLSRQKNLAATLVNLNLGKYVFHSEIFPTLSTINFNQLTSLHFGYLSSFSAEDANKFNLFLHSIGHQLKRLTLQSSSKNFIMNKFEFPQMSQLTFLSLNISSWDVGVIDFVLKMPNLNILTFNLQRASRSISTLKKLFSPEKGEELQLEWEKHEKLRIFQFKGWNNSLIIQKIVSCFPELRVLQVGFKTEELLPSLMHLTELKKLWKLSISLGQNNPEINNILTATLPNLLALKQITFTFPQHDRINAFFILNENGIKNGFLAVPKLSLLRLHLLKIPLESYKILMGSKVRVELIDCLFTINN